MKVLNKAVAKEAGVEKQSRPVRILQFGEGNFLRAFIDWMVDEMNSQGLYDGSVSIVQPLAQGMIGMMKDQDYLYTLLLRGIQQGEVIVRKKIIDAVDRAVNPYEDFSSYLAEAENPELRIIISNTTEAGIEYRKEDSPYDEPPASYPGKLLLLLKKRYDHFKGASDKGFLLFPCELIDRNGDNLKKVLVLLAEEWYAGDTAFLEWLTEANVFFNTLVDRIVSGYPRDEVESIWEENGYKDNLVDTGEIFHFLVIEGPGEYEKEFPLIQAGLNVKWCDDMTPYRTRKVRILNGAHTMTVLAAYLYGLETVKDCMDDEILSAYVKKGIFEEIIPTLDLPARELADYGGAILERFSNPYIKHFLLSISLNSVSKWKTRVMPSLVEYIERRKALPELLSFSLAALTLFYRGTKADARCLNARRAVDGKAYEVNDSPEVLDYFAGLWDGKTASSSEEATAIMKDVLSQTDFWGQDLSAKEGLAELTGSYLNRLASGSVRDVMTALIKE
jgi:tagaturonate reductase